MNQIPLKIMTKYRKNYEIFHKDENQDSTTPAHRTDGMSQTTVSYQHKHIINKRFVATTWQQPV